MKKYLIFLILCFLTLGSKTFAADVPTMDKDQLKSLLGTEDLVVYDVRQGRDWSTSEFKIKGAVRVEGDILKLAEPEGKTKTFVLYCA